jgi:hypothetical protein
MGLSFGLTDVIYQQQGPLGRSFEHFVKID